MKSRTAGSEPGEPDAHELDEYGLALEKYTLVLTLRAHPEWTLRRLLKLACKRGFRTDLLGDVTIGELMTEPDPVPISVGVKGEPPIDLSRRGQAQRAKDRAFDDLMLTVLIEARAWVGASYLRARLGGPRWKLQSSLARLVAAGKVSRRGTTRMTRYCAEQVPS